MTQLAQTDLKCPKCEKSFSVIYHASINTWMDPQTTREFLEGKGFLYKCPNCNQGIRLVTTIIISTRKGMFNISTDSSLERRRQLYQKYGLLNEEGKFGDVQGEWIIHQFAEMNAPEDLNTQSHRQRKILNQIHDKIILYKEKLSKKSPLDDTEEKEFTELRDQWIKEKNRNGTYLHRPESNATALKSKLLFLRLWEDLVQLKIKLDELK